ncbi:NADH-quinone oxidoreductase subunit NuoF [Thermostilla marina]
MITHRTQSETREIDLTFVDETVRCYGTSPDAVIPILQAIQTHYRYLPKEALERVCELTEIRPSTIVGVSTFYSQFRHRPVGEHMIHVCHGTACHVKGAAQVQEALEHQLKIPKGDDTDPDGKFTIQPVACLGCCTLAPVVQIDDSTYGRLNATDVAGVLEDFLAAKRNGQVRRASGRKKPFEAIGEVRVGLGSCCQAQGSRQVYEEVERVLAELAVPIRVKRVGCVGMCHQTPLLEIVPPESEETKLYAKVTADDVEAILTEHFRPRGLFRRMGTSLARWFDQWIFDADESPVVKHGIDVRDGPVEAFLGRQVRIATEFSGEIDPLDYDEYVRRGGFSATAKALKERRPQEVIDEVLRSGLRGRGGAGFPTGKKWQIVHDTPADEKYVICNGDEGDPGAFMDRMLLESFPFRVIEGMILAAYAVGAGKGYFYIRAEYPLAVERIREALAVCREQGVLGENVLGSNMAFDIEIKEGAGAFVCGEETALIASIEGKRGMPRLRPPYPAQEGLWGKPTLVNNVETLCTVPWIIRRGADAYARFGTESSKGTKVFALAGKIRRGGLIEVPMGITLRQIVDEIGGGVAGGKKLKAIQVGGPSGGCVPAELADTPVDFEALTACGAIMGSGGLVVLDETDCMVDIARYFLRFTQDQSCGKCTLCRVGTRRMLDILDRICEGKGKPGDLETLEDLASSVTAGSICGLGKTAPNPVLSTLRYFRHEYEAHLEGRCPAGRCPALIAYRIDADRCIGCTVCSQHCPAEAIPFTPYKKHRIIDDACTRCDTCRTVCPTEAVIVRPRNETAPATVPLPVTL